MAAERQAKTEAPEGTRERRPGEPQQQPEQPAALGLAAPGVLHAPPAPPDGPPTALRRSAMLRLQRIHGNQQVQRQLQRRAGPSELPTARTTVSAHTGEVVGEVISAPTDLSASSSDEDPTPGPRGETTATTPPDHASAVKPQASRAELGSAEPLQVELEAPPLLETGALKIETLALAPGAMAAAPSQIAAEPPTPGDIGKSVGAAPTPAGLDLASQPASALTMPATLSAPQLEGPPLQRKLARSLPLQREDEGGGLLSGVRQRISGVVDGLRSGWSTLTREASDAFGAVQGQLGELVEGVRTGVSTVVSGAQSAYESVEQNARQLAAGLEQQVNGALETVTGMAQSIGQAVLRLDAAALGAAWERLRGLLSGAWQQAQQAGQALFQRLTGLWNGLRGQFDGALAGLSNQLRAGFRRLSMAAQGVRQRLVSAWEGLRTRAGALSGVLGGILDRIRSLVSRLLDWGQRIWGGIQEQWNSLRQRVAGLVSQVQERVNSLWEGIQAQSARVWSQISSLWRRAQAWVQQQTARITGRVGELWRSLSGFDIGKVLDTLTRYAPMLTEARELVANPESAMQPIAGSIAGQLETGMPAAAAQQARSHTAGQGAGGQPGQQAAAAGPIQRQSSPAALPVAGPAALNAPVPQGLLWSVFWEVVVEKWRGIQLLPTIKRILHDSFFFWESVPREWNEMMADLDRVVARMNDGGLGFWRHLLDIPLIIWRRANNILTHLFPLFALLMTAIGAFAGAVGGTVGGAILGFFAGGVGAAPGAAAGGGLGIAGGAGAGLGFALGVGEGLLASYIAAEVLTLLKAWSDLSFVEQTEAEQIEDVDQMAGSAIGLGIAIVLIAISALAARLAEGLMAALKPGSVAQRFFAGLSAGFKRGSPFRRGPAPPGKQPPAERPPAETPPAEKLPGQEPPNQTPGQEPQAPRAPRSTELPPEEVARLVSQRSDGSFRLNRKNISNANKIQGEPEARVAEHAAREAFAAERAAGMNNVERVYMGREADRLINPEAPPGTEMSADVVGVTRQGKYVLIESKGTEILHGLEQLEHSAQQLGAAEVVRYELVVPEEIRTPGFSIENRILHLNGKPYTINGKPIHVRTTTAR